MIYIAIAGFVFNLFMGAGTLVTVYVMLTNRITRLETQKGYITEAIDDLKNEIKDLKEYIHEKIK